MTELQEKVLLCMQSMIADGVGLTKDNIIDYSGGSYSKYQLSPVISTLKDLGYVVESESGILILQEPEVEPENKEQVKRVAIIIRDRFMGYAIGQRIKEPFPRGLESGVLQNMVKIIEEKA